MRLARVATGRGAGAAPAMASAAFHAALATRGATAGRGAVVIRLSPRVAGARDSRAQCGVTHCRGVSKPSAPCASLGCDLRRATDWSTRSSRLKSRVEEQEEAERDMRSELDSST